MQTQAGAKVIVDIMQYKTLAYILIPCSITSTHPLSHTHTHIYIYIYIILYIY